MDSSSTGPSTRSNRPPARDLYQETLEEQRRLARDVESSGKDEVARIKDSFDKQSFSQEQTNKARLADRELKDYQTFLKTKRDAENKLRRFTETADQSVHKKRLDTEEAVATTDKDYDRRLAHLRNQNASELQSEEISAQGRREGIKQETEYRLKSLVNQDEQLLNNLEESHQGERERLEKTFALKRDQTQTQFEADFQRSQQEFQKTMKSLYARTQKEIDQVKGESLQSLNAYRDRNESDPFYNIHHFDSSMTEKADEYILRVRAPAHERQNLKVSMVGQEILLQGQRRNEDSANLEGGGKVTSSSYQAFKQTFPVALPVVAKMIYHEIDGEDVVYHLPKAGQHAKPTESPKIARLEATQKPFFPKNLPE